MYVLSLKERFRFLKSGKEMAYHTIADNKVAIAKETLLQN